MRLDGMPRSSVDIGNIDCFRCEYNGGWAARIELELKEARFDPTMFKPGHRYRMWLEPIADGPPKQRGHLWRLRQLLVRWLFEVLQGWDG